MPIDSVLARFSQTVRWGAVDPRRESPGDGAAWAPVVGGSGPLRLSQAADLDSVGINAAQKTVQRLGPVPARPEPAGLLRQVRVGVWAVASVRVRA